MGHERGAPGSAHPDDGVEAAFPMETLHDRGGAPAHRLDRSASVARGDQSFDVCPGRGCDLHARDIGPGRRFPEDPRVDEEHVDPVLQEALAQEGVLRPLRVQRSDRHDGRHVCLPRARSAR